MSFTDALFFLNTDGSILLLGSVIGGFMLGFYVWYRHFIKRLEDIDFAQKQLESYLRSDWLPRYKDLKEFHGRIKEIEESQNTQFQESLTNLTKSIESKEDDFIKRFNQESEQFNDKFTQLTEEIKKEQESTVDSIETRLEDFKNVANNQVRELNQNYDKAVENLTDIVNQQAGQVSDLEIRFGKIEKSNEDVLKAYNEEQNKVKGEISRREKAESELKGLLAGRKQDSGIKSHWREI